MQRTLLTYLTYQFTQQLQVYDLLLQIHWSLCTKIYIQVKLFTNVYHGKPLEETAVNRRLLKLIVGHLLYNGIPCIRQKSRCRCWFGRMFILLFNLKNKVYTMVYVICSHLCYTYIHLWIYSLFLKKKKASTHMEKFYKGVPKAFVTLR